MEVLNSNDEAPCCRVCHGESEPDNQLFFPCKCDGSIKYVHQPCLEQWLKVTGKTNPKCELCGEPFQFQKVYKSDAPYQIALYDVFMELIPRGWNLLRYGISVVFASMVWAVMLPLFTNWWLKACWCFISDRHSSCFSNIPSFIENQSTEGFMTFWYFGVVDVCIVIAASVISFEVGHTVYKVYCIIRSLLVTLLLTNYVATPVIRNTPLRPISRRCASLKDVLLPTNSELE